MIVVVGRSPAVATLLRSPDRPTKPNPRRTTRDWLFRRSNLAYAPRAGLPELRGWIASVGNPHLKALLDAIFADDQIAVAYRTAPAAKTVHHAWIGGLIEHVLSLCHLAKYTAAVAEGSLVIPIAAKIPLARAPEAQALAEKKHPGGKVLLLG